MLAPVKRDYGDTMVRAISNNNQNNANEEREVTFTPSRATKMLPLVRRIVGDILSLQASIRIQSEQLEGIDSLPSTIQLPDYQEEVNDIRASLAGEQAKLDACLSELNSLGVQLDQPFSGNVDFPAVWNRRPICLCWRPGDAEVMYFHELGQSAADRKKLEPSLFEAESFS